jgi:membrane peptidoglycan carboxypeptidase
MSSNKPKRTGLRQRAGLRRVIPTWRMVIGTALLFVAVGSGAFIAGYMLVHVPSKAAIGATAQSTVYLYADGSPLARDGAVNREIVPLSHVDKATQHAVLAAEDRGFYTESAVNPTAMARAAWNTATGKGRQSGSTITQQYVKNYYLGQEQTAVRKVKEFFISIKLDRNLTKDEILEGYLNTSYYGRVAYGVQAAAQAYFGVDADKLTVAQGAYLAALLNAPSEYDVVAHPENRAKALARWNYVLDGMVKENWLSQSERAATTFPKVLPLKGATGMSGQRGYLVEAVKQYLNDNDIVDEDTLRTGGYRITTTIQKPKETAFVKAAEEQLLDRLDKKSRKVDNYVRAGGASIDPRTGHVVAMYGGLDYVRQFMNNATRDDYQVGSTFKPFIFTSAVQNDSTTQGGLKITPYTYYDGTNKRPVMGRNGSTGYAPANEDDVSYGEITVTKAMDKSVNAVFAQMAQDVGPTDVKETAATLGVPADAPSLTTNPSMALGTANVSPLHMAQAYATLANHGKHVPYSLVVKITKNGNEIKLPERKSKQVVTREAADTTTSILRSVVDGGTGTAAQESGRPSAGKTGTAEEDRAAWFAGFTPNLATAVAVMGQDSDSGYQKSLYGALGLDRINGGGAPTEIWAGYTKAALKGTAEKEFDLDLEEGAQAPTPDPVPPFPQPEDPTGGILPPQEPASPPPPSPSTDGGTTEGGTDSGLTVGTTNGGADPGPTTAGGTTTGGTTDGGTDPGPTAGGGTSNGTDGGGTSNGTNGTNGTNSGGTSNGTDTGGTDQGATGGSAAPP